MSETPHKRRWYQFSLRMLFVLVTLLSVGFGYLGIKIEQGRRQHWAVAAIANAGARVRYDYEYDVYDMWNLGAEPTSPVWMRKVLGDDFFASVRSVDLVGSRVDDAILEHLRAIQQIRLMYLDSALITDAGLENLKYLTELRELNLVCPQLTDMGLANLQKLTHLKELAIHDAGVTDKGLNALKGLKELRKLYLIQTQVSDAGVVELRKAMPNCDIRRH